MIPPPLVNDYVINPDGSWDIYTADGLLAWNKSEDALNTSVTLMADITLPEPKDGESNWSPLGYHVNYQGYTAYTATFDGNGHAINNIKINTESNRFVGLFGAIDGGTVKDLVVEGEINVSGGYLYAGGIAGNISGAAISGCRSMMRIKAIGKSGSAYVGGIAGIAYGSSNISACCNSGTLEAEIEGTGIYRISIGGILGSANSVKMLGCYNTGEVSATNTSGEIAAGGIAGSKKETGNPDIEISECYWAPDKGCFNDIGTKVDGTTVTWETAKDEMNTALSEAGIPWRYATGTDTVPLVLVKQ